jgi:hypothetical protein
MAMFETKALDGRRDLEQVVPADGRSEEKSFSPWCSATKTKTSQIGRKTPVENRALLFAVCSPIPYPMSYYYQRVRRISHPISVSQNAPFLRPV